MAVEPSLDSLRRPTDQRRHGIAHARQPYGLGALARPGHPRFDQATVTSSDRPRQAWGHARRGAPIRTGGGEPVAAVKESKRGPRQFRTFQENYAGGVASPSLRVGDIWTRRGQRFRRTKNAPTLSAATMTAKTTPVKIRFATVAVAAVPATAMPSNAINGGAQQTAHGAAAPLIRYRRDRTVSLIGRPPLTPDCSWSARTAARTWPGRCAG